MSEIVGVGPTAEAVARIAVGRLFRGRPALTSLLAGVRVVAVEVSPRTGQPVEEVPAAVFDHRRVLLLGVGHVRELDELLALDPAVGGRAVDAWLGTLEGGMVLRDRTGRRVASGDLDGAEAWLRAWAGGGR